MRSDTRLVSRSRPRTRTQRRKGERAQSMVRDSVILELAEGPSPRLVCARHFGKAWGRASAAGWIAQNEIQPTPLNLECNDARAAQFHGRFRRTQPTLPSPDFRPPILFK